MLEDVAADDRLSLWLGQRPAELATTEGNQVGTSEVSEAVVPVREGQEEQQEEDAHEEGKETVELPGWADRADAYEQGERLMQAIVDAGYSDVAVALREIDERYYVVYKVLVGDGGELELTCEADIAYLIEQAELGQL